MEGVFFVKKIIQEENMHIIHFNHKNKETKLICKDIDFYTGKI